VFNKEIKRPFRIGLTGGIACGKSIVANMFADLGIPIIDTDVIAREVVQPGMPALDEIRKRFGEGVIDSDGHLDRAAMRKLIFSDAGARLELENILHPRISAETRHQSGLVSGPYQLVVVPLLVDSELAQFVDRILVIDCAPEAQIQRLMIRDAETRDGAQRILASQASREARLAIADDVIRNNQGTRQISGRVRYLDSLYRRLAETACPSAPFSETP